MFRAPHERILAERLTYHGGVQQTDSGLWVSLDEKKRWDEPMTLRVLSVGPFVTHDVAEGDVIVTRGMAGADVKHEGKKYISLHQDDVLAVLGE